MSDEGDEFSRYVRSEPAPSRGKEGEKVRTRRAPKVRTLPAGEVNNNPEVLPETEWVPAFEDRRLQQRFMANWERAQQRAKREERF